MRYLVFLLFPLTAWAQLPPAQPQALDFFAGKLETEFRLKKADGTTARLVKPTFGTYNAQFFSLTEACWNKASACPEVTGATVRVYFKLWGLRYNVTNRTLCNATECQLPAFGPLVAKPGEGYRFRYDRVTATWTPAPSVISMSAPLITVTPLVIAFNGTVGGPLPPAVKVVVTNVNGTTWTSAESCSFFRADVHAGVSGATQTLSPSTNGWTALPAGTVSCPITYSSPGLPDHIVTVTATK